MTITQSRGLGAWIGRPQQHGNSAGMWVAFACAVGLLAFRMPEAILRAEFWAEDGLFYGQALSAGPLSLADTYAGYFIVGIRAIALFETIAPPRYAPLIGNAVALLIMAGVAAFATSRRMPWDRTTGALIAIGIVLVPIGFELVGTLVHIVWPVMLWIALVAISKEPKTAFGRQMETTGLGLAGMTGIGVVLMSPLFLRGPRRRLYVAIGAAIIQLLATALTFSDRAGPVGSEWTKVPFVWLVRALVTPLLGDRVAAVLPAAVLMLVGGLVVAIVVVLLLRTPRPIAALVILLTVAVPLAGIVAGGESTADLMRPAWAPRYFWPSAVGLVILMAVNRGRWTALPLIALFAFGATIEFRIQPAAEMGWAERSSCIGGTEPCEIPVAPGEKWNVEWQP